ncbi:MAG: hypothetical protein GXZ04_02595 [Clostridiales bacterium]|nr:hypothetical protein [Clostridiales bacterium]
MRKRLLRAVWIGNALTLLLVVVFVSVMLISDVEADLGSLKAILSTASAWTLEASSNLQQLADQIASPSETLRVTFLMPNGIVLADSGDDEPDGAALLELPSVRQALAGETGEALSFSDGLLTPALHSSILLNGRLILHLSAPIREVRYVLTIYLPLLGLMVFLMVAVSRWLMAPVTRKMMQQLEEVRDLLEGSVRLEEIDSQAYLPELKPMMQNITYLIAKLRKDLHEISRTQDMQHDFVNNSSHELKSPLTSITGFAEMIHDDPEMPLAMRQEYLGYILQECERMTGIISDILLLERQSRLDVSTQTLLDVHQIANQVAASLAPQTAKRNITIEVSGQMRLRGEESDLWELLRNLMSNAVRYGVDGGWVKLQLSPHTLVVADNGIGIDQKHIGRLFEKFYRVDDSRHREDGGTGLGLAIVAAIINRYGATIHLDSVPGEGSRFTVQFPTA